jgi:hypothetical protein
LGRAAFPPCADTGVAIGIAKTTATAAPTNQIPGFPNLHFIGSSPSSAFLPNWEPFF